MRITFAVAGMLIVIALAIAVETYRRAMRNRPLALEATLPTRALQKSN